MKYYIKFTEDVLSSRYDSDNPNIPEDAVQVDCELFWKTINESDGIWKIKDGEIFKDPLINTEEPPSKESIQISRRVAYADPVSGSDRYFSEAASKEAGGCSDKEVKKLKDMGLQRKAQIQSQYPY